MQTLAKHVDVVQLLPSLQTGGAEKMVLHLSLELKSAGVESGVISFFDVTSSQLERGLRAEGIPVWSLGKRLGPDLAMIGRLRKLLGKIRPQVIHTHLSALRYAVMSVIGLDHPPRIVHTLHCVAERDSAGLRWLQQWCLGRGVTLIAVSEEVARSCARVYRKADVPVIPNGIPVRKQMCPPETRAHMRRLLGIDSDCFAFCCVASLRAVKNHRDLIEAFAGIAFETKAHLVLAGDGELRSELETLARALRIADQTHFLGEREDIAQVLAACDCFVLPSVSEGNPLSVLEAMASGLPVIATEVGGLPELVRSGSEGLLVPAGSAEALRQAMMRVITDSDLRRTMSRASQQRAKGRFDSNIMAQSYISIYELSMRSETLAPLCNV